LTEACCRIEFAGRTASSQTMADFFAECVQEATRGSKEAVGSPATATQEDWLKMTAFPLENDVSLWETMGSEPNRIKLRHHCANDERDVPRMAEAISRLDDVKRCQASLHSRSLTVDFRHSLKELNGFMDQAEQSFEQLLAEEAKRPEAELDGHATDFAGSFEHATGLKRVWYLALAGGMFMMTLVGLVVPGVPTVPFLLATSYFLARSSSSLDQKLRESVFFGSIVTEWERHRALSPESKAKLMALTGGIVLLSLLLAPLAPILIIAMVVVSAFSAYGVYRLPGLPSEARATHVSPEAGAPRLALPAP
jgi:uncharacterized membrane protein YbaN (DUF454 family)